MLRYMPGIARVRGLLAMATLLWGAACNSSAPCRPQTLLIETTCDAGRTDVHGLRVVLEAGGRSAVATIAGATCPGRTRTEFALGTYEEGQDFSLTVQDEATRTPLANQTVKLGGGCTVTEIALPSFPAFPGDAGPSSTDAHLADGKAPADAGALGSGDAAGPFAQDGAAPVQDAPGPNGSPDAPTGDAPSSGPADVAPLRRDVAPPPDVAGLPPDASTLCKSGERTCNGSCLKAEQCCSAADCPSDAHVEWACTANTCTKIRCEAGYGDCDNTNVHCETRLNSLSHCGSCGQTCTVGNGTPSCSSGACRASSCSLPFADCDSDPSTCETDTSTAGSHCGGCGKTCGVGTTCRSGLSCEGREGFFAPLAATTQPVESERLWARKFTIAEGGTLLRFGIFAKAGGAGKLRIGLFADSDKDGAPDQRVARAPEPVMVTVPATGVVEVASENQPTLLPGTYFLAAISYRASVSAPSETNTIEFTEVSTSGTAAFGKDNPNFSILPASFGSYSPNTHTLVPGLYIVLSRAPK